MGKISRTTTPVVKGGGKMKKPTKAKDEVKTGRKLPGQKGGKKGPASKTQVKKRRKYTEAELGIPKLNGIVPSGVVKTRGKKGKVFVDDDESLKAIIGMVNAAQEGEIESKLAKARHLEEIREAKRKEAEAKRDERSSKLEEAKSKMRRKRKPGSGPSEKHTSSGDRTDDRPSQPERKKKRVTFG